MRASQARAICRKLCAEPSRPVQPRAIKPPLAPAHEGRHHYGMIGAASPITILKYVVLAACTACWVYAVYHAVIFEGRLSTKDPRAIETLNHPATLFRS